MQHTSLQRTLRFIGLVVGFMLFVLVAFRSGRHISDPQYIKGKPFLLGTPSWPLAVSPASASETTPVATVASVAAAPTNRNSAGSATTPTPAEDSQGTQQTKSNGNQAASHQSAEATQHAVAKGHDK